MAGAVLRPLSFPLRDTYPGSSKPWSQLGLEGCSVVKLEPGRRCVPTRFPEPWLSDLVSYSLKINK